MSPRRALLLLAALAACASLVAALGADLTLWLLEESDDADTRWLERVQAVSFAAAVGAVVVLRLTEGTP